ncbi:MAG: ATP-binding protein [Xenococcaceae cyanobacterium]
MTRILLLLDHRENCRLLSELFTQYYEVLSPEYGAGEQQVKALLDESFDLCILDGRALDRLWQQIEERRKASRPVFLPVLLIVARGQTGIVNRQLWQSVDEVIAVPIEKAELQARVAILLRARQFSLDLKVANEQLEEMNRLKSRFVSMVSHEFRNPLTAVSGLVQLLERQGDKLPQEKKREYFQLIRKSIKRLTALVDDVLVIGRVGVGKLKFEPVPLEPEKFCSGLVKEVKFSAESLHQIDFVTEGIPVMAHMDQKLLRHILTNLLSNAIKYSPEGSTVRLTLSYQNNLALFRVQDEGIGIPLDDQQRLFEPFHRAANVGKISGTGLGLAIVKQCVDLHGGQITVTSELGVGTTFEVVLPLSS